MDLVLRQLKESGDSVEGVFVAANGDCCQLPNISGYNIFDPYSFLFMFEFYFLEKFVRMVALRQLKNRPINENSLKRIVEKNPQIAILLIHGAI